jgi:cytochrome P450
MTGRTSADLGAEALTTPLDQINVARPELFQSDAQWAFFERLRREAPVHYCKEHEFGPYWSITRYEDIMAVDTNHQVFSSESSLGGITIAGAAGLEEPFRMFISMDPPKHDVQRKAVSPIVSPTNLKAFAPVIRARAAECLDSLPIGETFDWVDRVSIELTTQMLATLFDFPFEERRKLARWSDVATAIPGRGLIDTVEDKTRELGECFAYFTRLWNQRINAPPANDLISMLAHAPATRHMDPREFHGNIVLLIVGGNDTTRNTLSGSVLAMHEHPGELAKLRADPGLLPSMVSETIRWQTPLAHMRRTALTDVVFRGKHIRAGDKVVMWYISGNRDAEAIEKPDVYWIDRPRVRSHLSFGFGIHRCVGNRLAELQLQIVWEEILKRFPAIEVMGEPKRTFSTFVHGFESLPVRIPHRL